ncbi:hypothetical protein SEA_PUPPER_56 [Gordonia phage Pupper]|uniref:Uncharacterized protein n=1 Tax=Gordonia phage Pupper TaxID=2571249 RepID=A0A4Y6EJ90_9CAUD|nr:hypothetical protein KHQ83_gp221 [Gordonia phage Pupper]QDF18542.1 hypothetical protein SEA_PUPPER_56 [Gordonia phage Pupper]QDF18775.1 hypothetical protein SEA_SCENTAE_56 [Gordonia phage SCentae]
MAESDEAYVYVQDHDDPLFNDEYRRYDEDGTLLEIREHIVVLTSDRHGYQDGYQVQLAEYRTSGSGSAYIVAQGMSKEVAKKLARVLNADRGMVPQPGSVVGAYQAALNRSDDDLAAENKRHEEFKEAWSFERNYLIRRQADLISGALDDESALLQLRNRPSGAEMRRLNLRNGRENF